MAFNRIFYDVFLTKKKSCHFKCNWFEFGFYIQEKPMIHKVNLGIQGILYLAVCCMLYAFMCVMDLYWISYFEFWICTLFYSYTILCVQIHKSTLTQAFQLNLFTLDVCASLDPKDFRLFFLFLIFCSVNLSSVYASKNTIIAENIKINGTIHVRITKKHYTCTCKNG